MKKYLIVSVVLCMMMFGSTVFAESSAKITAFNVKEINPDTRSVTLDWAATDKIDASLEVVCSGSVKFKTDKGNNPTCEKGGVWFWPGEKSASIVIHPYGNKKSEKVRFFLNKNEDPFSRSWKKTVVIPADPNYSGNVVSVTDPRDQNITDLRAQINALLAQIEKLRSQIKQNDTDNSSSNSSVPSVTVVYPNGGEILENGGKDVIANIQWKAVNFGKLRVDIDLLTFDSRGNQIDLKNIGHNIRNTGSFAWRANKNIKAGENYKIIVSSSDKGPSAQALSADYFEIRTSY